MKSTRKVLKRVLRYYLSEYPLGLNKINTAFYLHTIHHFHSFACSIDVSKTVKGLYHPSFIDLVSNIYLTFSEMTHLGIKRSNHLCTKIFTFLIILNGNRVLFKMLICFSKMKVSITYSYPDASRLLHGPHYIWQHP